LVNKGFSLKKAEGFLKGLYEKYCDRKGVIIPLLLDIQEEFGYLPEEAVNWIADKLDIPRSSFFGVATFYAQYHLAPRGKNVVTCCFGTACHVNGADRILNNVRRELDLPEDQDTTDDMEFTVEKVSCVGSCSLAPVFFVNKKIHGKASSPKMLKEIRSLKKKK
jgi:NADH:ubiquinone oxidoreductase subunit E